MSSPRVVFKKPPILEVGVSVQFLNCLSVADERKRFHDSIKAKFPVVIIPEQRQCQNDFGDYILYTQNQAERLEIGMNYFRYITTTYPDFDRFRTAFLNAFDIFRRTYELSSFNSFFYYYNNSLPIGTQTRFNEIFTVDVRLPGDMAERLAASQGTLLFQEVEGHVAVEFKPEWKEVKLEKYGLALRFGSPKQVEANSDSDSEIASILDAGHAHLERYFFSMLQPEYVKFLEQQQ
jgi:uncharacterized protein (TIGR04255 family)